MKQEKDVFRKYFSADKRLLSLPRGIKEKVHIYIGDNFEVYRFCDGEKIKSEDLMPAFPMNQPVSKKRVRCDRCEYQFGAFAKQHRIVI